METMCWFTVQASGANIIVHVDNWRYCVHSERTNNSFTWILRLSKVSEWRIWLQMVIPKPDFTTNLILNRCFIFCHHRKLELIRTHVTYYDTLCQDDITRGYDVDLKLTLVSCSKFMTLPAETTFQLSFVAPNGTLHDVCKLSKLKFKL